MSQNNNYKIHHRKQDLGKKIEQLHRAEQLAIGIIDSGSLDQLTTALDWYVANMNCCLHAVISSERGDITSFQAKYPDVTFIVFPTFPTLGEMVNTIADECFTTYFLVVRSDMEIVRFEGAYLFSLLSSKEAPAALIPAIANSNKEIVPSMRAPNKVGNLIDPISYFPDMSSTESHQTLYPIRGIGLFDRALFQRIRSYDVEIESEYWQTLDLGLRYNLYGNTIGCTSAFIVRFPQSLSIIEDRSPVDSMDRVHTRALSVENINGKNFARKFRGHFDRKVFNEEVKKRLSYIIKKDFKTLCEEWEYTEIEKENQKIEKNK
ncbi:MAG: hypothetical protein ACRQFF_13915 [Sphaerochaeta sp.]